MAELAHLTVHELLAAFSARTCSPVEVVDELAGRVEAAEATLNAFVTTTFDRAREQATDAERAWATGTARPLEGIPFAVKDLFDTAGVRTTYGSPMFDAHVPSAGARAVERAVGAGAILVGKTSTDEFAYGIAGVNPHYGPARNPWSPERVSGGSSSGSAVALAALQVPLALGSDTGGSIRVPSSYCGIVGLKGSWGAIDASGMWAMARSFDHVGPMARTPRDAAHFHAQLVEGARGRAIKRDLGSGLPPLAEGTRIGVCSDLDPLGLTPGVDGALSRMLDTLQDGGCEVREVSFADAPLLRATFVPIRDAETLYTHRRAGVFPDRRAEYAPLTFERLEAALSVSLDDYLEALATRERLIESFDRVFDVVDVIVAPVTRAPPPLIDTPVPDADAWDACGLYTTPFNLLGVPACAVRAGFDDLGLPVGAQIVGRYGNDARVLGVAQTYYDATPEIQERWPALPESQ